MKRDKRKPYIVSYNELDKVIIKVIQEEKEPLSAKQIKDIILNRYENNSLKVTSRAIGLRTKGKKNIGRINGRKGHRYYFKM